MSTFDSHNFEIERLLRATNFHHAFSSTAIQQLAALQSQVPPQLYTTADLQMRYVKLFHEMQQFDSYRKGVEEAERYERARREAERMFEIQKLDELQRYATGQYMADDYIQPACGPVSDDDPAVLPEDEIGTFAGEPLFKSPPKIEMPPGLRMLKFARFVFSPATVENVFEQIVADYQHEIFEALVRGENGKMVAAITARHWWGFLLSVAASLATSIGKVIKAAKGG